MGVLSVKRPDLGLVDVHVVHEQLEVSALVNADISPAADHQTLLQRHGVEWQQQQGVGDGVVRRHSLVI